MTTIRQETVRLTAAQALVRWLSVQQAEDGSRFIEGVWAIFGHGNVAGLGEALHAHRDVLPTWRGHNEQTMAHTAIAYAKASGRRKAMAVTTSIGPGATNLVTAAALAHVNRLPVLMIPGDVFASRAPDPVLQQVEDFGDGIVSANDCFRPVVRYFDRISRPEHVLTALPRALQVMTDPASCGPVCLAFCQDTQAEAFDYPAEFFTPKVWHIRRPAPDQRELDAAVAALRSARNPLIVAGGGVIYSGAEATLRAFARTHNIPFLETQAGKGIAGWEDRLNFGTPGVTGSDCGNKLAAEADVVLARRERSLGEMAEHAAAGDEPLLHRRREMLEPAGVRHAEEPLRPEPGHATHQLLQPHRVALVVGADGDVVVALHRQQPKLRLDPETLQRRRQCCPAHVRKQTHRHQLRMRMAENENPHSPTTQLKIQNSKFKIQSYTLGGYFCSLRCSDRRWMPRRRAASEMLPAQSDMTRLMCSHSARARLGGVYSVVAPSSGAASPRSKAASRSSASAGFCT